MELILGPYLYSGSGHDQQHNSLDTGVGIFHPTASIFPLVLVQQ